MHSSVSRTKYSTLMHSLFTEPPTFFSSVPFTLRQPILWPRRSSAEYLMSIPTTSWIFSLILAKIFRFALLMSFGAVACARARHVGACEIRAARKRRRPRRRADLLERAAQLVLVVLEDVVEQNVLAVVIVARRGWPRAARAHLLARIRERKGLLLRRCGWQRGRLVVRAHLYQGRVRACGARHNGSGSAWPCICAPGGASAPRSRGSDVAASRHTHRARQCQGQKSRNSHHAPNRENQRSTARSPTAFVYPE